MKAVASEVRGFTQTVTLERPVEGITAGTDSRSADTVFNLSASGGGAVVRNNTMTNHRRFGVLMKGSNALVEGNTIDGVGGSAIVVGNDPGWPEGPCPSHVTIRGNTIRNVGRSGGYNQPRGGAIQLMGRKYPYDMANDRILRGLVVEGNTIVNPPGAAIFVGAARDVAIRDNMIIGSTTTPRSRSKPCGCATRARRRPPPSRSARRSTRVRPVSASRASRPTWFPARRR
ncbi:MAG: right-handed parallel beta-helix repeat-containing protein [bacterium]|nr:right-handed parallel beta-helix repeat-containing protein [bacterium]